MAKIDMVDQANKKVGTRELNKAVFGLDSDAGFVHRVYSSLASAQRFGNSKTKSRGEVSGGGRKPFKQKGTGRARQVQPVQLSFVMVVFHMVLKVIAVSLHV